MRAKGCTLCHSTGDAAVTDASTTQTTATVGPSLKGIFGSTVQVLTSGQEREVSIDEAYLRRSILDPSVDVVKGFRPVMPPHALTDEELTDIISYLREL